MTAILCALSGYLAGSIPFALLVSRAMGLPDPRTYGSGNIGATNVLRSGSRRAALLTVAGDAGKGWLAVLAAMAIGLAPALVALTGFCAFLGHVFPVWLKFKGGKGVATALGVLLVVLPLSALIGFVTWLVVLAITRISSIGSLLGALLAIVSSFFMGRPLAYSLLGVGLLLAMLWTHRGNLERIFKRTENRV